MLSVLAEWASSPLAGYRGRSPKQSPDAFCALRNANSIPLRDTPPRLSRFAAYHLTLDQCLSPRPAMRMTRAALKAQAHDELLQHAIHEDSDASDLQLPSPSGRDPEKDELARPALKDITYENHPTADDPAAAEPEVAPGKRAKSTRGGRKTAKKEQEKPDEEAEPQEEAALHDSQDVELSEPSQPDIDHSAGEASELPHEAASSLPAQDQHNQHDQHDRQDLEEPATPSYGASIPPKTPRFDPEVHRAEVETPTSGDAAEDSFLDKIRSRSPSKAMQAFPEHSLMIASPDSFAEQLASRTLRIEDSVEEIDRLEDALEEISEKLPVLESITIDSPVKAMRPAPALSTQHQPARETPNRSKATATKTAPKTATRASAPAKPTAANTTKSLTVTKSGVRPSATGSRPVASKPTQKAPTIVKAQKKPLDAHKKPCEAATAPAPPSLSFSNSPIKPSANTTKKRVPSAALSTSKPGFVPAKSTKAPTRSSFQLPGEAFAEKRRLQREERLKREEEAEREKKLFKARPAPSQSASTTVAPRANRASQARLSMYANGVNKENIAPKPAATVSPRPGSLKKSNPDPDTRAVRPATTAPKPAAAAGAPKVRTSAAYMSAGQKIPASKDETAQQKAKSKERLSRAKGDCERVERERREKEEAASRARAEAAERGRQASREWAEKQKKKLAQQAAAKRAQSGHKDGESAAVAVGV